MACREHHNTEHTGIPKHILDREPEYKWILSQKSGSRRYRSRYPDNTLELAFGNPRRGVDGDI